MPTGFSCSLLFWTPKKQLHFGPGKNWRNYNYLLLYLVQFGEINQISVLPHPNVVSYSEFVFLWEWLPAKIEQAAIIYAISRQDAIPTVVSSGDLKFPDNQFYQISDRSQAPNIWPR